MCIQIFSLDNALCLILAYFIHSKISSDVFEVTVLLKHPAVPDVLSLFWRILCYSIHLWCATHHFHSQQNSTRAWRSHQHASQLIQCALVIMAKQLNLYFIRADFPFLSLKVLAGAELCWCQKKNNKSCAPNFWILWKSLKAQNCNEIHGMITLCKLLTSSV